MSSSPDGRAALRRRGLLAALGGLGGLAGHAWADTALQQAVRRAEALRHEALRAGDQHLRCGALAR